MKCLLIIDVQNGFVSKKTEYIVPKIEQLMLIFSNDLIVATQFVNLDDSAFEKYIGWKRLKNKPEIDLIDVVANLSHRVIEKNIYSSCTPEFMKCLSDHNITEVYLAGIDTDCCVLKTATDLFERKIRPVVLVDYCASNGGEESHLAAIRVMERTIGRKQIIYGEYNQ